MPLARPPEVRFGTEVRDLTGVLCDDITRIPPDQLSDWIILARNFMEPTGTEPPPAAE